MFIDSETIEDAFDREKAKITNRRSVNVPQLILCALEIKISIELFDLISQNVSDHRDSQERGKIYEQYPFYQGHRSSDRSEDRGLF